MISGVSEKRGEKSTKMLTEVLNLDCGLGGDFYSPLYLSVFSAINNTTYITYYKKITRNNITFGERKNPTHIKVYERNPTPRRL